VRSLVRRARVGGCLAVVLLWGARAGAHGLGVSQLRLRVDGARVEGAWEVQVADARRALGLQPDGAGGFAEVAARDGALHALLARGLALTGDGAPCPLAVSPAPASWSAEQSLVTLEFSARCPHEPRRLGLRCDLLFDVDPRHRAYYSVEDARASHAGVLRADARLATAELRHLHPGADFVEFLEEGVRHIWSGLDHLLFLLALLLPAPLVRAAGGWAPRPALGGSAREVLKVVTAFTVAHSLTLALAFFGVVSPPARAVEVAIALSVLLAAWNNLRPFLPGRAWVMAFAFGLVHGLGFAGALRNLALPLHARGLALAAFNVGVELGQLAIVAPLLPVLYLASRRTFYPRLGIGAGSLAIAWVAALWIIERGFGVSILS
jgi:hypothetical protein